MGTLKALVFDVDGTLADTERDGHRVAFNEAFADFGLDWHWSDALYGELLKVAGGKERIRYYIDHYTPAFTAPGDLDEYIARLHAEKTRRYVRMLEHGEIPLRPGVRRLLEEARAAGLILAIATTTSLPNVQGLLRHCLDSEAESWFDLIAAGDMVPAKKPAPDIYRLVLERLGLAPGECIAFEDSDNGLRSARGAGIETVVTVNDYTRSHDFPGALLVVDQLGGPGQPFTVLDGDARGHTFVDTALLTHMLAGRCGAQGPRDSRDDTARRTL